MNPARMVFEHAPAFIPVPVDLQHRRVEAILWPLDDSPLAVTPRAARDAPEGFLPLSQLIGKAQGCFASSAEVDAFMRAERDAWDR